MRPAPAERVTSDLCHGEEMQHLGIQAMETARREVGHDVVVENRREKGASKELRKRHVCLPQRGDPIDDEALQGVEETSARQQRNRQKERKKKVVLGVLLRGFA